MSMHRFFAAEEAFTDRDVAITGADLNHLRVLRLNPGDLIVVCNGDGIDYICRLATISAHEARAEILESYHSKAEPSLAVTLYQGLPKADKMDWIVQKCTEVGVSRFVPVSTARAVVELSGAKAAKRAERWRRIAEAAAKQSGRGRIPKVESVMSWTEALDHADQSAKLAGPGRYFAVIPYELEKTSTAKAVFRSLRKIGITQAAVFVGPEGGFTEGEIQTAVERGIRPISLGPRILRTETAGLLACGCLLYELEME